MERFDPIAAVSDALAMVNATKAALLRALLLPSLALAALGAMETAGWSLSLLNLVCTALVYAVFAASCHRVLLLGADALPNRWGLYFTLRELRFLAYLVALWAVALAPVLLLTIFLGLVNVVLPGEPLEFDLVFGIALLLAGPPAWYVFSRASLLLPQVAIGLRPEVSESWNLSRGNGCRLALVLAAPILVGGFSVRWIESIVAGHEPLSSAIVSVLALLQLVLEVAVVSASFRRLDGRPAGAPATGLRSHPA